MAQIVTRVDQTLAAQLDELVADGVIPSRSEAVRLGLEWLVDKHLRERIGNAIVESYRRLPQSEEELAGIEESTRALIEEEPW